MLAAYLVEAVFISHKGLILLTLLLVVFLLALPVYGVIVDPTETCKSCHGQVRHGTTGKNSCNNCHNNTEVRGTIHVSKPFVPGYMHDSFDWEGDDSNEKGYDRLNESCQACHKNVAAGLDYLCEGCHVKGDYINTSNPVLTIRKDIAQYIPKVYSHYTGSDIINVPDQSGTGKTVSSCYGFDPGTGEGTCHGVTFANKEKAGGYYAHNSNYTGALTRSDPSHWNSPADTMPDTTDCRFCHLQQNDEIKRSWGNPSFNYSKHDSARLSNEECWNCHYNGKPTSFHGKKVERGYWIYIILVVFAGIVVFVLLWREKRSR